MIMTKVPAEPDSLPKKNNSREMGLSFLDV